MRKKEVKILVFNLKLQIMFHRYEVGNIATLVSNLIFK